MDRLAKRRVDFRALGLCACGKVRKQGLKQCNRCLSQATKQRQKNKSTGGCDCGNLNLPNRKKCQRCLDLSNNRVAKFKKAGLCYCGKRPPKQGFKQCQQCLENKKAKLHALKAHGKCQCGKPTVGKWKLCPACRKKATERMNNLLKTDKQFAASSRLRNSIYTALKRKKKGKISRKRRSEYFLGCTFEFAQKHIESLFEPGMDWDNRNLWHIDHYIPRSFFNLLDERHQLLCSNWRNLRPLWVSDNLSKKDRLPNDLYIRLSELEAAIDDPMFQ